ncbi:WD repeat and coiled-coil-containing protein-like [Bufo gargarizans]|uniref:WD repeat and coiled-coil-containing protein-like n=1 Tax=Bufo gargarizans TaxID=30331 RepID=UPI001CF3F41C|nr:WD repeat and coiled-coil-containing protein-like [Bufo gargarizans]
MDLGRAKLLRCGMNALHQAFHNIHGLAWTDGKQVILTALHLQKDAVEFGSSVVIGQFEHVHGLFWGPATDPPALLAVQHKKHVTIWQLYYNPLEKNKLVVSQTCEYGDPLPVLPQGCIWHPKKDILVVLTKKDVSVLYTVSNNNSSVKADITCSSVVRCACWTKDGSRVVVAMEDSLHSYTWNDDLKTLSPCSFCPIFNIEAPIVAVQPIMDYQVVVTSEISTKPPYGHYKDSEGSAMQSSLLMLDEELSRNRRVSIDSGKSEPVDMLKVSSLMPTEMSKMLARHRKSDPSPLMYLRQRSITGENKTELSNLLLITFEKNSTTTRKVSIPGISSPDIIALDSHSERVAVASNTCNLVLIYPIAPSCMPNIQQIRLEENERAKGLSFLTDTLLLILVGRPKSSDLGFLHILASEKYTVQLVTRSILPIEYIPSRINCDQNSISDQSGLNTGCLKAYDLNVGKELWMPNHIGNKSPRMQRKIRDLVQEASGDESPTSSLDDYNENKLLAECPVTLENLKAEPTVRRPVKGINKKKLHRSFSQRSNDDLQETNDNYLSVGTNDDIEGKTNFQGHPSGTKDSSKMFSKSLPYPTSDDPPYISISQQNSSNDQASEARAVLLCHGKLHFRTLQETFHFNTIEMKFGSKWIILTEDGEGFVPITFRGNEEVVIREVTENSGSCGEPNHEQKEP